MLFHGRFTKVRPCIIYLLPIHSSPLTKSSTLSQTSGNTEGARRSVDSWFLAFLKWDRLGLIVAAWPFRDQCIWCVFSGLAYGAG